MVTTARHLSQSGSVRLHHPDLAPARTGLELVPGDGERDLFAVRAHSRRADKCGAVVIRDLEPALAVLGDLRTAAVDINTHATDSERT